MICTQWTLMSPHDSKWANHTQIRRHTHTLFMLWIRSADSSRPPMTRKVSHGQASKNKIVGISRTKNLRYYRHILNAHDYWNFSFLRAWKSLILELWECDTPLCPKSLLSLVVYYFHLSASPTLFSFFSNFILSLFFIMLLLITHYMVYYNIKLQILVLITQ